MAKGIKRGGLGGLGSGGHIAGYTPSEMIANDEISKVEADETVVCFVITGEILQILSSDGQDWAFDNLQLFARRYKVLWNISNIIFDKFRWASVYTFATMPIFTQWSGERAKKVYLKFAII